jgi:RNA polymerase sigma-54 factor
MELKAQLLQQQKLVMTMQMRQAIQVLQLNNQEIEQFIEEELLSNPAIEEHAIVETMSEAEVSAQQDLQKLQGELLEERNHQGEDDGGLWEAILSGAHRDVGGGSRSGFIYNDLPPIETNHSVSSTLLEELLAQLRLEFCTDEERRAAEFIIGNLDHRGYLDCTYLEVQKHMNVELDDVEGAILLLRELDPIGCGARSLQECLQFQVEILFPEDPFFVDIIHSHLHDFKKRTYQKIADAMDMDIEDVEEYHKMLQELEPHPGRPYDDTPDQVITADIKVMKVGEEWQILSEDRGIPRLRVNQLLQKMKMAVESTSDKDKKFLEERVRSAKFLLESLHHRERTIVRVMESILRRQLEFFEYGVEYLRPMVLRDVALDIEVHESTVSRISNGKYAETPFGLLEIKYFFNSSIRQIGGLDLASVAVKAKIKNVIAKENPKKPYSDNKICKILAEEGISLARRTVTKYREAMHISSSRERKDRS